MIIRPFVLAFDFDGTVVAHRFPSIGEELPGAIDGLRALARRGALLLLWTVRDGAMLAAAVAFLKQREVPIWSVNANPLSRSSSPKVMADAVVDDMAIGCPTVADASGRRAVNWSAVLPIVEQLIEVHQASQFAARSRHSKRLPIVDQVALSLHRIGSLR